MASLTTGDIATAARKLAEVIFVEASAVAHSDLDTLKALVKALDDAMEAAPTALPQQTSSLQVNLNSLGVAAAPNSTLPQRLIAMQIWAAKKAGLF